MRAGRLRCVGLDATPAGHGIYLQRGFVDGGALVRMRAEPATAERKGSGLESCPASKSTIQDLTPAPLAAEHLERVLARDREVFGADRGALLRWAHASAPDLAWATPGGAYCFGRHGDHSDHVGPVVAEDRESALALVRACLSPPAPPAADPGRARRPGVARRASALSASASSGPSRGCTSARRGPPRGPPKSAAILGPEFG